jgi:hypothetical protein
VCPEARLAAAASPAVCLRLAEGNRVRCACCACRAALNDGVLLLHNSDWTRDFVAKADQLLRLPEQLNIVSAPPPKINK